MAARPPPSCPASLPLIVLTGQRDGVTGRRGPVLRLDDDATALTVRDVPVDGAVDDRGVAVDPEPAAAEGRAIVADDAASDRRRAVDVEAAALRGCG